MRRTAHTLNLPTEPLPPISTWRQPRPERIEPPEPEDREPVVRATHVEVPALDAAARYPELYDEDDDAPAAAEEPEAEPEEVTDEPEPAQEELTPMGNRRSPVTESEDVDYLLPKPTFLKRSNGSQRVDTKGIERTGGS